MSLSNISPTSYKFSKIELENSHGDVWNITKLVTEVEITESIYSKTLEYEFTILDSADFFNYVKISGNEKITLVMEKFDGAEVQEYTRAAYVTGVPLYARPKSNVQVYKLSAVSEHFYLGNITRLSKKFQGSFVNTMKSLYNVELNTKIAFIEGGSNIIKGVFPNITVNDAIDMLMVRAYNERTFPYYVFETFNDGIHIESFKSMIENVNDGVYKNSATFTHQAKTKIDGDTWDELDYNQKKYRIIAMSSDLGFSKIRNVIAGVYSSRTLSVDVSTKTFATHTFNKDGKTVINKNQLYSPNFQINGKELGKFNASYKLINKNQLSHENAESYNSNIVEIYGHMQSVAENIDEMTHIVTLSGDPALSAGSIIDILLPRSIDPGLENRQKIDAEDLFDQYMSGKYLIINTVHRFVDNEYTCSSKIARDSVEVPI